MVSDTVVAAILSLMGSLGGTFGGILVSNRLTNYRLEQLEKKVQAHNNLVERTYRIEGHLEECMRDIKELKGYHKPG